MIGAGAAFAVLQPYQATGIEEISGRGGGTKGHGVCECDGPGSCARSRGRGLARGTRKGSYLRAGRSSIATAGGHRIDVSGHVGQYGYGVARDGRGTRGDSCALMVAYGS